MNIIIKETGKQEVLELIDRKSGVNSVIDLIGNHGALDQFDYDSDNNVYVCDQITFDWWAKVVADQQALEDRIAELKDEYGSGAVYEAIGNAGDCDLEDQAAAINAALDEAFPAGN